MKTVEIMKTGYNTYLVIVNNDIDFESHSLAECKEYIKRVPTTHNGGSGLGMRLKDCKNYNSFSHNYIKSW